MGRKLPKTHLIGTSSAEAGHFGRYSPVFKAYAHNLKAAYYLTNLAILLLVLSAIGYQQGRIILGRPDRSSSTQGGTRIILTYSQLGPPPSILGDEPFGGGREGLLSYRLGQPRPVKDSLAVQETSPSQQEIAGRPENFSGRLIEVSRLEIEPVPIYRVDVVPVLVKQVAPVYPEKALRAGLEGTVVVEGIVNVDGAMINLRVRSSSGFIQLDSAALFTVSQYQFTPGRQKDRAIPVIITIPVEFKRRKIEG